MTDINHFPFQVGKMVYPTVEEAKAKAVYAAELYNVAVSVVDRRTDEVVYTYPIGVK